MKIYNRYGEMTLPDYPETSIIGVYGTLKRGMRNFYLLKNSKFLGQAIIRGLKMYSLGGIPGVKPGNRSNKIKMELFEVSQNTLRQIDKLEGIPYMYQRYKASYLKNKNDSIYFYLYQGKILEERRIESW